MICIYTKYDLCEEPWSSGKGSRLATDRSWVRITMPGTRWKVSEARYYLEEKEERDPNWENPKIFKETINYNYLLALNNNILIMN